MVYHAGQTDDIPIVMGGNEYRTDNVQYQVMPHDYQEKIAKFYWATPELVKLAVDTSLGAKNDWAEVPVNNKMDMFLMDWDKVLVKNRMDMFFIVADQMTGEYIADKNAIIMLGQVKIIIQA